MKDDKQKAQDKISIALGGDPCGTGLNAKVLAMTIREKGWQQLKCRMPSFSFKPEWQVIILPPWSGAAVRFYVHTKTKCCSIYLHIDDSLGYMGAPYWEIMELRTVELSDPKRFRFADHKSLQQEINRIMEGGKKPRVVQSPAKEGTIPKAFITKAVRNVLKRKTNE